MGFTRLTGREIGVQVLRICHSECNEESAFERLRFFIAFRMTRLLIDRIIISLPVNPENLVNPVQTRAIIIYSTIGYENHFACFRVIRG
jgi:hypothetical protein